MGFDESATKLEQAVYADPASANLGISELVTTTLSLMYQVFSFNLKEQLLLRLIWLWANSGKRISRSSHTTVTLALYLKLNV